MSEANAALSKFTWRHVLYRLFDADGALLYIGRTSDIDARFPRHAAEQPWWHEVAACSIEFLPSQQELVAAEADAIRDERPRHNKVYPARRTERSALPSSDPPSLYQRSREVAERAMQAAGGWYFTGPFEATESDPMMWLSANVCFEGDQEARARSLLQRGYHPMAVLAMLGSGLNHPDPCRCSGCRTSELAQSR